MTNNSAAILMVVMILFCSLSGCIDGSSEEKASQIEALEREILELEKLLTMTNATLLEYSSINI